MENEFADDLQTGEVYPTIRRQDNDYKCLTLSGKLSSQHLTEKRTSPPIHLTIIMLTTLNLC